MSSGRTWRLARPTAERTTPRRQQRLLPDGPCPPAVRSRSPPAVRQRPEPIGRRAPRVRPAHPPVDDDAEALVLRPLVLVEDGPETGGIAQRNDGAGGGAGAVGQPGG